MTNKEKIKKEIDVCLKEAKPIILYLQEKSKDEKYSIHVEYQKWYSKVIKIVEFLAPERFQEFKSYYEIDPRRKSLSYGTYVIQDFLKGVAPNSYSHSDFDTNYQTLQNLYNQYTILNSIAERFDNVISNIGTAIFSEFQDLELSNAQSLLKVNVRAAGVIAGVILESFLQKVTEKHVIKLSKKNPTLSDLNEILKNNEIYDVTYWRKISYLSDLRNICAHKKDVEPTKEQVSELIEGVNWATKNIY